MTEEFYVNDIRHEGDPSFNLIPHIETFAELKQHFGMEIDRKFGWDLTPVGKACWKLVGFEVRTGSSEYIVKVMDHEGRPRPNILVIRWWPDVDKHNEPIKPQYFGPWWDGGFTNGNGNLGCPFGGGNVTGPTGGVDAIWVSASPPGIEPQFSDCVYELGWIGGTHYLNAAPHFQYVVKTTDVPTTGDAHLVVLNESGVVQYNYPLYAGAPGSVGQPAVGVMVNGQIVYYMVGKAGAP
jgi:hypothetical protein